MEWLLIAQDYAQNRNAKSIGEGGLVRKTNPDAVSSCELVLCVSENKLAPESKPACG